MDNLESAKRLHFFRNLLVLVAMCLLSSLIAPLAIAPLLNLFGMSDIGLVLSEMKKGNFLENLNGLRIVFGVIHLFTFVLPSLLFVHFFIQKPFGEYTYTQKFSKISSIGFALIITLLSQSIAMLLYYLNNLIPENWTNPDAHQQTMLLLQMNAPLDLVINLIVIGLLAGVGEELLFRGIVQRIFAQRFESIHWGIWISAITFSLIHFEVNAFLPRMMLGALFGYLFWWSGSLWIPIICHTLYNGIQVALVYFYPEMTKDIAPQEIDLVFLGITLACAVVLIPSIRFFIRYHQASNLLTTSYLTSNFEPSSSEDDDTLL